MPKLNPKKCKHNLWDGYGLMILHGRLQWIRGSNPKIYRIYEKNSKWEEVGEFYRDWVDDARKKGLTVELQNNSKLMSKLEADIKRVEKQIEEHKKCKSVITKK